MTKHEKNITPVETDDPYYGADHGIVADVLRFFLYKNGVYYFNTLQETVTDQNGTPDAIYIDIPDDEWDDFAAQFSMKVYHSKSAYRNKAF